MNRRFAWLLAVLVALGAGYGVMLVVLPEARSGAGGSTRLPGASEAGAGGAGTAGAGAYETVAVTLEIPAARDVPTATGHCPKTRLGNILGVTFASTHGLVIGTVIPGGPADKAGIKPGDMLSGGSECPRTVLPRFEAGEEPREMKVNARRRGSASQAESEERAPGEQEVSGE
jgi:hypothetical protein